MFFLFLFLVPLTESTRISKSNNAFVQYNCGFRDSLTPDRPQRSMNTPEATRIEAPWTLAIAEVDKAFLKSDVATQLNNSDVVCSGTVISSRHVLTAAHCFKNNFRYTCPKNVTADRVQFNVTNFDDFLLVAPNVCVRGNCSSEMEQHGIKISQIFISDQYVEAKCSPAYNKWQGDIAVVELAEDLRFSTYIQPACVSEDAVLAGNTLSLYGYGFGIGETGEHTDTGTLRRHDSTVKEECLSMAGVSHENLVCSASPSTSGCPGDSGAGQIVYDSDERAYVAAVIVAGKWCCQIYQKFRTGTDFEAENTSVSVQKHAAWICQVSGVCPSSRLRTLPTTKLLTDKCQSGYSYHGKQCMKRCLNQEQCQLNATCTNDLCTCDSDFALKAGQCVPKCKANSHCDLPNSTCRKNLCQCDKGYVFTLGQCLHTHYNLADSDFFAA